MFRYQRGGPKLKEICDIYGVLCVQKKSQKGFGTTVDIMVDYSNMRVFPIELDLTKGKAFQGVTYNSTNDAIDDEK